MAVEHPGFNASSSITPGRQKKRNVVNYYSKLLIAIFRQKPNMKQERKNKWQT
jgi:hypothetical protein